MKNIKKSNTSTSKNDRKREEDTEEQLKTIYVDTKELHLDDESIFAINPTKLNYLAHFEKECFDMAVIQNTPTNLLKTLGLFYLVKVLKPSAKVEVYIDQPISVMQQLDASEIEAIAKLAGFVDIVVNDRSQHYLKSGVKEVVVNTMSVTMSRPETLKRNFEVDIEVEEKTTVQERIVVQKGASPAKPNKVKK